MVELAIRTVLSNFTVTLFVVGLLASGVAIARQPAPRTARDIADALLRWFLFFSIGVSMFYNFVVHVFFGAMIAGFIGWTDSPFQTEVGLASLGFSLVGFFAWRRGFDARFAALLGPACFLWGAAAGHVYDIAMTHNMAPGNAGAILYTDILLPVAGFVMLWLTYRGDPSAGAAAAAVSRNSRNRP